MADANLIITRLRQWTTYGAIQTDGSKLTLSVEEDDVATLAIDLTDWLETGETVTAHSAPYGNIATAQSGGVVTATVTADRSQYGEVAITTSAGRKMSFPIQVYAQGARWWSDYGYDAGLVA